MENHVSAQVRSGESFSLVAQTYLIWSEAEQQVSPETIGKRIDCLHQSCLDRR